MAEGSIVERIGAIPEAVQTTLPEAYVEEKWYAVYTWTHHEKRVAKQMEQRQIHGFLPLYCSIHRWKDRCKEIEMALFPSYAFVNLPLKGRLRVLEIPGAVNIVSSWGKPTPWRSARSRGVNGGSRAV